MSPFRIDHFKIGNLKNGHFVPIFVVIDFKVIRKLFEFHRSDLISNWPISKWTIFEVTHISKLTIFEVITYEVIIFVKSLNPKAVDLKWLIFRRELF